MKYPIQRPAPGEIEWFDKNLNDLVEMGDLFASNQIDSALLSRAFDTFTQVADSADHVLAWRRTTNLHDEGALVTPDSYSRVEAVTMASIQKTDSKRKTFNQLVGAASIDGATLFCRPLPITWSDRHITDRFDERSPNKIQTLSIEFVPLLGLATMMAKIYEDQGITRPRAFILPAERGIYLGVAEPSQPKLSWNRFQFIAANNEENLRLNTYKWMPEVQMHINTYFGPNQMTQPQRLLKAKLASLVSGTLSPAFYFSNDEYMGVKGHQPLTPENQTIYEKAYDGLKKIMQRPEWASLRLPQKMQRRFDY